MRGGLTQRIRRAKEEEGTSPGRAMPRGGQEFWRACTWALKCVWSLAPVWRAGVLVAPHNPSGGPEGLWHGDPGSREG